MVDAVMPRKPWGKQDNRRTAHVAKVVQDSPDITTIALTEMQILELIGMLSAAMRERAKYKDGYHLALRKAGRGSRVEVCHANPPCNGGNASIALVRPQSKS
jgi:hypothetical protein